jgi:hypothetical protein
MKKQRLSPQQALAAMAIFLERYRVRTGESDDLSGLLGDIQINPRDGRTFDPAAWADWLSAIETAIEREHELPAVPGE